MCSRNCSIAPALKVSAAATTTEILFFCKRLAILATVVVFPVPLIPTNRIRYGSCGSVFDFMFDSMSTDPASSNMLEIFSVRLFLTKSSISFLLTLLPTSFVLRSDFILSITSVATSDSKREISSSDNTSSISFSFRSFSLKLLAAFENALPSFSNIIFFFIFYYEKQLVVVPFAVFPALNLPQFVVFDLMFPVGLLAFLSIAIQEN